MFCPYVKHLYCSEQLSMPHMEKRYRNKIIIFTMTVALWVPLSPCMVQPLCLTVNPWLVN